MSYEGYEQLLCENGHYWTCDAYEDCSRCPICGVPITWSNAVDETNGESVGYIDISAFISVSAIMTRCNLGYLHETSPAIYHIPTQKEAEDARTIFVDGVRTSLKKYLTLYDVHHS